jgi:ABC-type antimicrobial peptide transport system permease subunit
VRREVQAVDPAQPIYAVQGMNLVIEDTVRDKSLNTTLLSVFAGVSLLLALIGVYGVMSYTVAQHTREIGIRIALGAQPGSILKLILGRGFVLVSTGVVIGVLMSFGLTRFIENMLFGVYPNRSADVCNDRDPARIRCPPRLPDSSHTRTACRSDRRPAPHVSTK